MPSAEETTYLIEVMPDACISQESFTSRDVDVLVSRIKENLRLSNLKSRSSLARKIRPSPYRLPSRSWDESSACELYSSSSVSDPEQQLHCRRTRKRCRIVPLPSQVKQSYERFEALLRQGALIREAVKRLQTNPDCEDEDQADDKTRDSSDAEVEEGKRRTTSTTLDSMDDKEEDDEEEEEEEEAEIARRRRSLCDNEKARMIRDNEFFRRKTSYYDQEKPLPAIFETLKL